MAQGREEATKKDAWAAAEARPVRAWIDLAALRHNAGVAQAHAGDRAVIGVVKADAYGHGAAEVAHGLLAAGVTRLAVVSVAEGAALRRSGIVAPILLLGGLDDAASAERAHKWGLSPVLQDQAGVERAAAAAGAGSAWAVEVEVDTGMHRMGVAPDEAAALLAAVAKHPSLALAGVFTHLAQADGPDATPSQAQTRALGEIVSAFVTAGHARPAVHVVNSAGLLRIEEIEAVGLGDGSQSVRPGLMLYGVSPFSDRTAESLDLRPVMTLQAAVVAVRSVRQGEGVGYGADWRAPRDTRIATLPLGYADGIARAAHGEGAVWLSGAMRPLVGRVSMDSCCVEIGEAPTEVGDVATIFGHAEEGGRIPVEDWARSAGTIGYEMLVRVGARVPRHFGEGPAPAGDLRTPNDRV